MAHSKSALKRVRQNESRRFRNRSIRSAVKTGYKKVLTSIESNNKDEIQENYRKFVSLLDRAVKKNVFHKNFAARKKSNLSKKINTILK